MKSSIKERPLTLKEYRRRYHEYSEASAPIIKEMSRLVTMSTPKMILHVDGTLEIKYGNEVKKIKAALKEMLDDLYRQTVFPGGNMNNQETSKNAISGKK